MSVDTLGNFFTQIRNGIASSKSFIITPYSGIKRQVAEILKDEGFIREILEEGEEAKRTLKVILKYVDGESAIHEIKRMSTPGRRAYKGAHTIEPVIGGLGVTILTTNRGVITNKKAKELGVGGEIICTVW